MAKTNTQQKRVNLPLIITAAVIVVAVVLIMIFSSRPTGTGTQVISEGENFVIPTGEITETASFYPLEVDGVSMEVLAVRDDEGNIRTAFNTCQSCFTSGRGYYVQEGDDLVCQNCGFHFTPEEVEVRSGGCNPWPIFPEDKTVTENSIEISYDFLKSSTGIFSTWKL